MPELAAVPIVVLARTQDFVAVINSTLRNAGLAAHCTWVRENKELSDNLATGNIELVLAFVSAEPVEASTIIKIRNQVAPDVPVVFVRERIDEEIIAVAMQMGARDVVTLGSKGRLQAVVAREIRAFRTERELASFKGSARQTQEQMKSIMAGTADAIAYVQEGIVVDVNPAWLSAFGLADDSELLGHPLMDSLDASAHGAVKSAVVACLQGRWAGQTLKANARLPDRSLSALEFQLARAEHDGEPAVRFSIAAKKEEREPPTVTVTPAKVEPPAKPTPVPTLTEVEPPRPASPAPIAATPAPPPAPPVAPAVIDGALQDAATGLLQRRPFIDRLQVLLNTPPKSGIRQFLALEPDKLVTIVDQLGPVAIEEFVAQFAAVLAEHFKPSDLVGRFGECMIVALIERGTTRDVEAMIQGMIAKVGAHIFHVGGKSILCTISAAVCLVDLRSKDTAIPLTDATQGLREAQAAGGNRLQVIDKSDEDTKRQANDAIWVRLIKSALMENRFKLMQQPIASLLGGERNMFDVLVRMVDEQGSDILPAEFMAAADRNDLMKNIDRWIISNAMAFSGSRPVERLFVRLSRDSVCDKSLTQWLTLQLKSTRIDPSRIAFQVSEAVAAEYLGDTSALASAVRKIGFKFALEHFGSGRDSARLLSHLTLDYLKIDGSLMQSLPVNPELQARVKDLVDAARNRQIATIAERVEDANTMAILWQLGVEYIQGYFINEPEQVVMG